MPVYGPDGGPPRQGSNPYPAPNPYSVGTADLMPGVGYQQAQLDQQKNQLSNQLNYTLSAEGEQESFLSGNLGRQLAGQRLDVEGLGIQRGGLMRQENLSGQQYGLQKQGYKLQEQQQNLGRADIRQRGAMSKEAIHNQIAMDTSQAAGSGSLFTAGHRANSVYLGHSRQLIRDELNRALQNWTIQRKQLGLAEKGAGLSRKEQIAQQKDQEHNLEIISKRLNLSKQDIQARLQNAINQLKLGAAVTVKDLSEAIVQNAQGYSTSLDGVISQVYGMQGITPFAGGGGRSGG